MKEFFLRPLALVYSYVSQRSMPGHTKPFTYERWLPPLARSETSSSNESSGTDVRSRTVEGYDHTKKIPVTYTNDHVSASRWMKEHLPKERRPVIVGWDVESAPNLPWKKFSYIGPATVQISVKEAALVLQIAAGPDGAIHGIVPLLKEVLADESIIKAGVGIDQDMLELYHWGDGGEDQKQQNEESTLSFQSITSRLDIGCVLGQSNTHTTASLKTLANKILQVELKKSRKLAMSNWGRAPLTDEQLAYAARDAWVAAAVLAQLETLDSNLFSAVALRCLVQGEYPIDEMSQRAATRKTVRTQLNSLLQPSAAGKSDNGDGDSKSNKDKKKKQKTKKKKESELTEAEQKQLTHLKEQLQKWAPARPPSFDVDHLNLSLD